MKTRGFTILELLIALAVLSVMYTVLAPMTEASYRLVRQTARAEQFDLNKRIGESMLTWMDQRSQLTLPTPFTGTDYHNAPVDVTGATADSAALGALVAAKGLSTPQTFSTSSTTNKARVYQRVSGISINTPIYGISGPTANILYDVGVLYVSDCNRSDVSCYPSASGVAGYSPVLTSANVATWALDERDEALYQFSTYDLQMSRLKRTMATVDSVRDAIRGYFSSRFLSGAPDPNINYFPAATGSGAPVLGGANPSANDGCRDGWYDLAASDVNVLPTVGLLPEEFARTAWGASIAYCRDFDPSGTSPEGQGPQNAAIRINRRVSEALAPGAAGTNLIFSM